MLKPKYFLKDIFILSAEKQPINSSWRKIEWLLSDCQMKNVINMDITTKIKRSKLLYYVYYYVMSGLVNLYKLFLKPDGKLMLFVCYGGRHYSDSTRVIYEAMLKDERFKDYIGLRQTDCCIY